MSKLSRKISECPECLKFVTVSSSYSHEGPCCACYHGLCSGCGRKISEGEGRNVVSLDRSTFCSVSCMESFAVRAGSIERACLSCGVAYVDNAPFCSWKCAGKSKDYVSGSIDVQKTKIRYESIQELIRIKELSADMSVRSFTNVDHSFTSLAGLAQFEITFIDGTIIVEDLVARLDDHAAKLAIITAKRAKERGMSHRLVECNASTRLLVKRIDSLYGSPTIARRVRPLTESVWMSTAAELSLRSTCLRNRVGAVIVDSEMMRALAVGYNGDESGGLNECDSLDPGICGCIHAETNCLTKLLRDPAGSMLFVTLSPCVACAKLMITRGIKSVIYLNEYRTQDGIDLLRSRGVSVTRYDSLWSTK